MKKIHWIFIWGLIFLSGCDGCNKDELVHGIIVIGSQPATKIVRISGVNYMKIEYGDPTDYWETHDGYLKVYHNPNCGSKGNEGVDRFFDAKKLPDGAKLLFVQFSSCNSGGVECSGNIFDDGRLSSELRGPLDEPRVEWYNTCTKVCAGRWSVYIISFLVSVPFGTDLGEPTFDEALNYDLAYDCNNGGGSGGPAVVAGTGSPRNPQPPTGPMPCNWDQREVCAGTGAVPPEYVVTYVTQIPVNGCTRNCQTLTIEKPCDSSPKGSTIDVWINSPETSKWKEQNTASRSCNPTMYCQPCDDALKQYNTKKLVKVI